MIVPESLSRDAGKWELKVKPEMGVCVCDNSLKSRKTKQNAYEHLKGMHHDLACSIHLCVN